MYEYRICYTNIWIQRREEQEEKEKEKETLKTIKNEENVKHGSGRNSAQRNDANGIRLSDLTYPNEQEVVDGNVQYVLSKDKKRLLKREGSTSGFTISLSFSTLFMMIVIVIAAVAAVVVYRMAITAALTLTLTFSYASTVATITGKMYDICIQRPAVGVGGSSAILNVILYWNFAENLRF